MKESTREAYLSKGRFQPDLPAKGATELLRADRFAARRSSNPQGLRYVTGSSAGISRY
jgi:hypothetical protein